jgi:hypothetical protein
LICPKGLPASAIRLRVVLSACPFAANMIEFTSGPWSDTVDRNDCPDDDLIDFQVLIAKAGKTVVAVLPREMQNTARSMADDAFKNRPAGDKNFTRDFAHAVRQATENHFIRALGQENGQAAQCALRAYLLVEFACAVNSFRDSARRDLSKASGVVIGLDHADPVFAPVGHEQSIEEVADDLAERGRILRG